MKLSVLWHAENTVCRGKQCRIFSMLLWEAWSWHCNCPSGRAQAFFPPTRHDVPKLSASNAVCPRRVVKSSRAARLKLPQRPHRRPLYDAGADTSRKLLPSHRTFTPMCVSMNRLSSVLFMTAFPSSLYGAVTLWPFTLTRIFWPKLIFKVPTYREQKLFEHRMSKQSLFCYCHGYIKTWVWYIPGSKS